MMNRREFLKISSLGISATSVLPSPGHEEVKFWQEGNFRPVHNEVTVKKLKTEGHIPAELSGLYVRDGINPPTCYG